MKANVEQKCARNQMCEEKKARLSKVDGISPEGDFEQIPSGWGETQTEAACFECGDTDHFKAQFAIWVQKKKKRTWG